MFKRPQHLLAVAIIAVAACTPPYVVPSDPPIHPSPSPVASSSPIASSSPAATPTPATASGGALALTPPALSFIATGASNAQQTVASEVNYTGTFHVANSTCTGIATITQSGATFTVTPAGGGSCVVTIGDDAKGVVNLNVGVTVSSFGVQ